MIMMIEVKSLRMNWSSIFHCFENFASKNLCAMIPDDDGQFAVKKSC